MHRIRSMHQLHTVSMKDLVLPLKSDRDRMLARTVCDPRIAASSDQTKNKDNRYHRKPNGHVGIHRIGCKKRQQIIPEKPLVFNVKITVKQNQNSNT